VTPKGQTYDSNIFEARICIFDLFIDILKGLGSKSC